jgi:hypothetical protein
MHIFSGSPCPSIDKIILQMVEELKCIYCQKKLISKQALIKHIEYIHTNHYLALKMWTLIEKQKVI